MKSNIVLAVLGLMVLTVGCDAGPKSARGFSLPDGDVELGKTAFLELKCTACHTVSGAGVEETGEGTDTAVTLGGEVARIKSYGELVTSIINPSHRLATGYPRTEIEDEGQSKMKNYNDVMTVRQLIDLVAFLQSHYELKPYEPTEYPMYY